MKHEADPGPDEITAVRAALDRRAGRTGTRRDPSTLHAAALTRARTIHRRQNALGALAAVALLGAVLGGIAANHGRATVGVSVGDGGASPTTDATVLGGEAVNPPEGCASGFFGTEEAVVTDHFGSDVDCEYFNGTWVVSLHEPGGDVLTVAVLTCPADPSSCQLSDGPHDFSDFTVAYLPVPVGHDVFLLSTETWPPTTADPSLPLLVEVAFGVDGAVGIPPTSSPVLRFDATAGVDAGLTGSYVCTPTPDAHAADVIAPYQPWPTVPGSRALAEPLPAVDPPPSC